MNQYALPSDFNIDAAIPTLTLQLNRVPLRMYFHNLVMRLENDKAKRDGRMYDLITMYC